MSGTTASDGSNTGRRTAGQTKSPTRQAPKSSTSATSKSEPGGLQGLIARRARRWSLDTDETFYKRQRAFWHLVMDHYFRMEVNGWHRIPDAPALLVGVHAGGILPIDAYTVGFQWHRHFGMERPLHGTSHDALMAMPIIGDYLRKLGTLPASAEPISTALANGHDVIIWPGGDLDALRPWTKRDTVVLGGRQGFVKQAIKAGVPIQPVATVGGADTLFVLTDGKRIAKFLRLDKLARSEVFPIAAGFPFGLAPGIIPQIPLPAKIRTEFMHPVDTGDDPQRADDDDFVQQKYREVERRLQEGVDGLARRRSFPIFG